MTNDDTYPRIRWNAKNQYYTVFSITLTRKGNVIHVHFCPTKKTFYR